MEIFESYDHKCTATFLWFTVHIRLMDSKKQKDRERYNIYSGTVFNTYIAYNITNGQFTGLLLDITRYFKHIVLHCIRSIAQTE